MSFSHCFLIEKTISTVIKLSYGPNLKCRWRNEKLVFLNHKYIRFGNRQIVGSTYKYNWQETRFDYSTVKNYTKTNLTKKINLWLKLDYRLYKINESQKNKGKKLDLQMKVLIMLILAKDFVPVNIIVSAFIQRLLRLRKTRRRSSSFTSPTACRFVMCYALFPC